MTSASSARTCGWASSRQSELPIITVVAYHHSRPTPPHSSKSSRVPRAGHGHLGFRIHRPEPARLSCSALTVTLAGASPAVQIHSPSRSPWAGAELPAPRGGLADRQSKRDVGERRAHRDPARRRGRSARIIAGIVRALAVWRPLLPAGPAAGGRPRRSSRRTFAYGRTARVPSQGILSRARRRPMRLSSAW